MGNSIDVQVLYSDGSPIRGAKVEIFIDAGLLSGGRLEEYADDDGHAEFETGEDYPDYQEFTILVRGQSFGPYEIGGGAYTVQLD